jgi:hypothetical protein
MYGLIRPEARIGAVIEGANAGATVYLGVSSASVSGATCPLTAPCLDLVLPALVGSARADANGRAEINLPMLPRTWDYSGPLYFQAATATDVSPTVEKLSAGRASGVRLYTSVRVDVNTRLTGTAVRSWTERNRTLCQIEADLDASGRNGLANCPNCQFTHNTTLSNYREVAGDCHTFLGVDPSQMSDEQLGLAIINAFPYFAEYRPGLGWQPMWSYPYAYDGGYYGTNAFGPFDYVAAEGNWRPLP